MKFSQRIAKRPIRASLQLESMDDDLKHKLWNLIFLRFLSDLTDWSADLPEGKETFFRVLWHSFFKRPIDTIPIKTKGIVESIRSWYYKAEWFDIYDLIEFLSDKAAGTSSDDFDIPVNHVLEEEMAGYRLVNRQITPITDEHELREIELALENSRRSQLKGVTEHLESALDKLADRENPDFRNSIKESISAVEGLAKLLANKPKAQLSDALKALEQKIPIHGALKSSFLTLYGYTSDSVGIRHAMMDQSTCDFEDAKFMLVACAAFVNYMIVKAQKAQISLKGGGA